ncbi:hypothetical protein LTR66_014659 [Elasticomyces elasticus]|nr:hypothetical protein LTR66_014659 [Elasticomyces elasticus]
MSDYGSAPMADQQKTDYPNLDPYASSNGSEAQAKAQSGLQNARDSVYNNASAAYDSVANHPMTQNVVNGPVAEKAKEEVNKTSNEFSNLANSRKTPDQPAATGQSLTNYHSMFYNLLSWENPRATGISFATTIVFIFGTRYIPVLKYLFKGLYIIFGITAAAEIAGKVAFDKGLATQMRPRKYYVVPKENLERALEDVEQLINFFVIEVQRIIFVENVYATIAAFTTTFIGYWLVKFVPKWGLALIATTFIYTLPLIYVRNREQIDNQLERAGNMIGQQTQQAKEIAAYHTGRATETVKNTASTYTAKAQEMVGHAKNRAASPGAPNPANLNPAKHDPEREVHGEDFPTAPREAFHNAPHDGPVVAQAEAGSAEPIQI